jgi:hypothetical protein
MAAVVAAVLVLADMAEAVVLVEEDLVDLMQMALLQLLDQPILVAVVAAVDPAVVKHQEGLA